MKTRIVAVLVICAAGGIAWYILNPSATPVAGKPAAAASTPKPATIEPPKAAVPARVAAPVAPPVAASASTRTTTAARPAFDLTNPQPQADLKNCIAQTSRCWRRATSSASSKP